MEAPRDPWNGLHGPPSAASNPSLGKLRQTSEENEMVGSSVDGTVDRVLRRKPRPKFTGAIFIHAGAGFHSHQNERFHLEACNDAALMGMQFIRSGAPATEAVEAALRVLEDKEITNAGYGSNLSIDGTVECDATIVDHLGRSGACGAVPNIRNPICLAKLILDKSTQPLTLRRVPPNLLVAKGARVFAENHGTLAVPNDSLVSKNARERFRRWQEDLRRAEEKLKKEESRQVHSADPTCPNTGPCQQYDTMSVAPADSSRTGSAQQRDHANAIFTGTWNEGQPDSPYRGTPVLEKQVSLSTPQAGGLPRTSASQAPEKSPLSLLGNSSTSKGRPSSMWHRTAGEGITGQSVPLLPIHEGNRDGGGSPRTSLQQVSRPMDSVAIQPSTASTGGTKRSYQSDESEDDMDPRMDLITDTVGAIAIDVQGRIAAGSSSGGIGMKHSGRIGPAALVNIGTAVIPVHSADPDGVCVATVTSGTGEHMLTTCASLQCAERIYRGKRRGPGGRDIAEDDEDQIMESFVTHDFMGHPGVTGSNSVPAIGVMTVKKTSSGCYLYFAHNTDSFALASMGGSDKEPQCVMSRLGRGKQVTRGARKITLD